ncbi:type I restriction endonuclease subunit R, partial [Candidatus Dependentiae bacterium]|nr:type I restriction endonuclease subunit R [Candidatus Dependentiae bacterium]
MLDYKETIPQIFWYNALIVLSKGVKTKVGTISSKYEHFNEWKILKSQERDCHAQTDAELKISAKEKEQNYVIARSEATRQSQKDNPVTSSLEITINEIFRKETLLDILENFILFHDTQGSISKIAAKYHQYYGVNDAIEEFHKKQKKDGRLGVFWHTQGAGKSFSMI